MTSNIPMAVGLGLTAALLINLGMNMQSAGQKGFSQRQLKKRVKNIAARQLCADSNERHTALPSPRRLLDETNPNTNPNTTEERPQLEGEPTKSDSKSRSTESRHANKCLWATGTMFFVLAQIIQFAILGIAPQSLVAALQSTQFMFNVPIAWLFGDRSPVTFGRMAGVFMMVFGTILIVIAVAQVGEKPRESMDEYAELWGNGAWHVYLIFIGYCSAVLTIWRLRAKIDPQHPKFLCIKFPSLEDETRIAWVYAGPAVMTGSLFMIQAKLGAEFFDFWLRGNSPFRHWFFWFTISILALLGAFWFWRLNRSLEIFPPQVIIPTMMGGFNFFAIMCGGVFFEEFSLYHGWVWPIFIAGTLVMFGGLWMINPSGRGKEGMRPLVGAGIIADLSQRLSGISTNELHLYPEDRRPVGMFENIATTSGTTSQAKKPSSLIDSPEGPRSRRNSKSSKSEDWQTLGTKEKVV